MEDPVPKSMRRLIRQMDVPAEIQVAVTQFALSRSDDPSSVLILQMQVLKRVQGPADGRNIVCPVKIKPGQQEAGL